MKISDPTIFWWMSLFFSDSLHFIVTQWQGLGLLYRVIRWGSVSEAVSSVWHISYSWRYLRKWREALFGLQTLEHSVTQQSRVSNSMDFAMDWVWIPVLLFTCGILGKLLNTSMTVSSKKWETVFPQRAVVRIHELILGKA